MTNPIEITEDTAIKADELAIEQLERVDGGASHGTGGGSGKVQMQDLHFLLPAV